MSVYITRINGLALADTEQYRQNMVAGIAHSLGIREMGIYRYNGDAESAESLNARIDGIIAGINREDLVICQFPTGNGLKFEWALINHLKAYGGRIAIFLHDLEPLRYEEKSTGLWEVVNLYNQAEVMIIPSLAMRQFLLDNRIRRDMKFVIQEIWDYISDPSFSLASVSKEEMIFNELSKAGFGLVWYESMHQCQYMEYSIPFSLSKFLASGIPVIVPDGISVQKLIEGNRLGLVVQSVEDAVNKVEAMTETVYQGYVQCVQQFAPALRKGYYTQRCLVETLQMFYRKDAGKPLIPTKVYDLGEHIFASIVLKESYGGLALTWNYKGNADGLLIYDSDGKLVFETENVHQHYYKIKGYGRESRFIVKAFVDTLKGRLVIAESGQASLDTERYEGPRVSLLISAFNSEDYIARSIDTALAQTFSDIEIVIVDDGSTDGTAQIIDWYANKYLNVIAVHQKNGGTPSGRNTGITYAKGDYIGFLDSDDMLHPDMVAKLYDAICKNDCDVAVTSIYLIKDGGYEAFIQYPMEENTAIGIDDFFEMHFTKRCMFATIVCNKLYKSSLVKKYPFPILAIEDDAWTPYFLSYANTICYINDCLYEYDRTIQNDTVSDRVKKEAKDTMFRIHKKATMFYLENGNPKRQRVLKKLAKRQLLEMGNAYSYDEYERLWRKIDEEFCV